MTWNSALNGTSLDIFGNNLVMNGNVATTGAPGVLMVAGNSFKNVNSHTITTTGGGVFLVYSVSPTKNILGGLTGASEFSTSYPTAPDFSGSGFIYSAP